MSPKGGLDSKAKAMNQCRRAAELTDAADIRSITNAMTANTWSIRHVMHSMKALGINLDEYRGKKEKAGTTATPSLVGNRGQRETQGYLEEEGV